MASMPCFRTLILLFLLAIFGKQAFLQAQNQSTQRANDKALKRANDEALTGRVDAPPTNAWQKVPSSPEKTVAARALTDDRVKRDKFADLFYGIHQPIEEFFRAGNKGYSLPSVPVAIPGEPDIPKYKKRTIVVATFVDYTSILSASRESIYSEAHLKIERVIDTDNPQLALGSIIDLLIPGGTVKLPSGQLLSYATNPRPYVPEPGHKYIFFLHYVSDGNFYVLKKLIELKDGKAVPSWPSDIQRARANNWRFANKDTDSAVSEIESLLQQQRNN